MTFRCEVEHIKGDPCSLEYREVSPGEWEVWYERAWVGSDTPLDEQWVPIGETSLDEIREIGHDPK